MKEANLELTVDIREALSIATTSLSPDHFVPTSLSFVIPALKYYCNV